MANLNLRFPEDMAGVSRLWDTLPR